jgi:RNA polymerase sigma-70 factor (ECF subfamily)
VSFEDAVLVRQVQAGQVHAYADLVRKYQDRVYNTCWRICGSAEDARDLTQDVFLKALESIGTFRGRSAFYTWIFRIAANMSISYRRKRVRRSAVSLDDPVSGDGHGNPATLSRMLSDDRAADPADGPMAAETRHQVAQALAALEPDYRAVIVLRDIEQFDYQEIADILEVALGTVKSRLHRGRMALRELLKGECEQESRCDDPR